jgi:hypothetical protein
MIVILERSMIEQIKSAITHEEFLRGRKTSHVILNDVEFDRLCFETSQDKNKESTIVDGILILRERHYLASKGYRVME